MTETEDEYLERLKNKINSTLAKLKKADEESYV
jgi:hypothetical protein